MASEESFVVLVQHRGSIKRKTRSGVKFTDKDPLSIFVRPTTSYDDLASSVLRKFGLEGVKRVKKFFYRILISILQEIVKYDCFTIGSDEDLQLGGSNRNTPTLAMVADSSSRPADASSSIPVYEPPVQPVASPSFAVDLDGSGGGEQGDSGEPAGFGAIDAERSAGLTEFQVGQQFQDKDEAVLSVKTYSIRRGVQYLNIAGMLGNVLSLGMGAHG
ncbi:hypothetical protein Ahy_A09g042767 [Arachis hypogaea]|uniref:Transposase MuDR plant domain-containing protein n=1 Tax=Arachis hypogaea TaxID=3818 RepID=A0A445BGP8_ARAHY|nr:hypothetical protein Ahy_A09g042767 [Arachis hypogaea]